MEELRRRMGDPTRPQEELDYLRSAKPVDTYAQGITVRQGNRVSLVQVNVWQEDPNRPVASTRGHILMPQ